MYFKRKTMPHVLYITLLSIAVNYAGATDFYAYHTKVQHSATDYMGKYADIIVVIGDNRLEFTRQTAYLPVWQTAKGVYHVDDLFPGRDQDFQFYYNYIRLLENNADTIVVHWRYFTDIKTLDRANSELDPLNPHGILGVVHELFTITPDGRVEREVLEAAGTRSNDWQQAGIKTKQILTLKDEGIEHAPVIWGRPVPYLPWPAVKGNPEKDVSGLPQPIRQWTFNDGMEPHEDMIIDAITEVDYPINGLMTLFKKGVSGTALAFDGYYTGVTEAWVEKDARQPEEAMSIIAWIALDVYPYNNAPIVHQSEGFGEKGYYLGIDAYGHPFFTLNGETIKAGQKLPLYQWTQVAVTAGKEDISLYINGEKSASQKFSGNITLPETRLTIGRNTEKARCTDFVRTDAQNLLFLYGIQGLLDEITLYDQVLSENHIQKAYKMLLPANPRSDLAKAVLPGETGTAGSFGAAYKTLQFHELWDNLWRVTDNADIVVKFDKNPCSVVYWRGTNYAANWITDNNRWMADQSSEIFTKHGCSEHMADKQLRHSYARIIENTPARVVVHWRYPCVDVSYYCANRMNWSDEYHTIYPDGTGIRKVVWNKKYDQPGFQDIQFFTNPGETALDVVDIQAMTLANLDGKVHKMRWQKPNIIPENPLENACIQYLNTKSEYKIFVVYQGGELGAWGTHEQSKYTDDPFAGPWNHWPIYLVPSDGRFAVAHDRVTHFALGANDAAPEFGSIVHYGFTREPITTLVPVAAYWRNPPAIEKADGLEVTGFDKDQKAYCFKAQSNKMSFTIAASVKRPVVNPCFVIKNWNGNQKATLRINKKNYPARQGVIYDTDGEQMMVIWIEYNSTSMVKFELEKI
jgi:hypothetical protein